jgi:MFS family permease
MSPTSLKDPSLKYKQNSALYATFSIFGLLAGGLNNILGPRLLLFLGGLTYALYSSSYIAILLNGDSAGPYAIATGALLGAGAGLLWAAQGAMIMAYPPPDKKGSYFAIFWVIFNLGAVLGSIFAS